MNIAGWTFHRLQGQENGSGHVTESIKTTTMVKLEIPAMLKREMERKRIDSAELTHRLKVAHSTVSGMLQRPTMQVHRLVELSELFEYNFFREIAQKLPLAEPDYSSAESKAEVAALENRVRDLELEISILRQTIKDLVSR